MAGAEAAAARRRAATTVGHYNIKLGPSMWRFGSGLGLEYNDNVRYTENGEGDFIFRPSVRTSMVLPLTDQNSLNFSFGGGYSAYLETTELSQFFITPGSELSFDMYVGDFWINFHDRFSITENGYQDPTYAGGGDYARLENAAGITTVWDLNRIILRAGYDHMNYNTLSGSDHRSVDGQSEVFFASAGYAPKAGMVAGVEGGASLIQYDQGGGFVAFSDAVQWNSGVFSEAQLTEYIKVNGSVGYTVFSPDLDEVESSVFDDDDVSGMYALVNLDHRLNEFVSYTLTGGRNITYTFYGGTADLYFARLVARWRLLQKITLSTSFDYDGGKQYTGASGDDFDRYGGSISIGRNLTKKLSSGLTYRYYRRDSESRDLSYSVNIVSLNFSYSF